MKHEIMYVLKLMERKAGVHSNAETITDTSFPFPIHVEKRRELVQLVWSGQTL